MSTPFGHSLIQPDWVPWRIAASIAAKYVGQREQSRNRSPFILRLWRETWPLDGGEYYERRDPWCAAFVSWCLWNAAKTNSRLGALPFRCLSPSVRIMRQMLAGNSGARIVKWRDAMPGDVITFLPAFSHVGIVEEKCLGGLITIEGNTNGAGSREGDGVYRKKRAAELVARCDVWRLPVGPAFQ
jgi:hypothetical protein